VIVLAAYLYGADTLVVLRQVLFLAAYLCGAAILVAIRLARYVLQLRRELDTAYDAADAALKTELDRINKENHNEQR